MSKLIGIFGLVGCIFLLALHVTYATLAVPPTPDKIPLLDQTATLTDDQKSNLAQTHCRRTIAHLGPNRRFDHPHLSR